MTLEEITILYEIKTKNKINFILIIKIHYIFF